MPKWVSEKNVILDLCGGTGSWSKPYADDGFTVELVTLPDLDVTQWVGTEDHIRIFSTNGKSFLEVEIAKIYGILAAPPCTEFSRAKSTPRDFDAGLKTVRSCLDLIWHVAARTKLEFWALENPEGYLRHFLGLPALTFEPWWYGDAHTKQTDLWGYFNRPRNAIALRPVALAGFDRREEVKSGFGPGSKMRKDAAARSVTPIGFARLFHEANSKEPDWWKKKYGDKFAGRKKKRRAQIEPAAVGSEAFKSPLTKTKV